MDYLSNDHEDHPSQSENSHKLCDETGNPIRSQCDGKSMETETPTWSEFLNGGKVIVEQTLVSEERNLKAQDCESHSQGPE